MKLILKSNLCPGDMAMMSSAIRDLHKSHPGVYLTDVRTFHPDIWRGNPHITPIADDDKEARVIEMHYPLINSAEDGAYHFMHGYRKHLEGQLGIRIKSGPLRGDIHLSREEIEASAKKYGAGYWVVVSGGKSDFTAKHWDVVRWQEVVDHWGKRGIHFVQVGDANDMHPLLSGVNDLRGKTSLRDLLCIVANAAGVLCPVTSLMHFAAALPMEGGRIRSCVVVAGGREGANWERYPGHKFLDTIGQLPCCERGGCWKARVWPGIGGDLDKSLCERPVLQREGKYLPACLDRITPQMVIEAMEGYMKEAPPVVTHKKCCGADDTAQADPRKWGPLKWQEWHAEPDTIVDLDPDTEREHIGAFIKSLPCEDCRRDFTAIVEANPPAFRSMDEHRWWKIERHNDVNRKLGKRVLSIEEAEAAIERNRPRSAKELDARYAACRKCEHHVPATRTGPPVCKLDGACLKEKTRTGQCEKWPGYVPELNSQVFSSVDTQPSSTGVVGVVIGTYGATAYIHLQLESLRRFHPGTPVLVVDDGSPSRDDLAKLCNEYGADFLWREKRMNHARGDMHTFVYGHRWAKAHGVGLLVKFSRRWVPVAPWIGAALWLWQKSGAPTLCNTCSCHGFGFRSECVAMDVNAWANADACDVFEKHIAASADQPGDLDVGKSGMLVEHIAHIGAAAAKAKAQWDGALNFEPWPWMGTSRCSPIEGVLWHETHKAPAYAYQAAVWGLNRHITDFINPNENIPL